GAFAICGGAGSGIGVGSGRNSGALGRRAGAAVGGGDGRAGTAGAAGTSAPSICAALPGSGVPPATIGGGCTNALGDIRCAAFAPSTGGVGARVVGPLATESPTSHKRDLIDHAQSTSRCKRMYVLASPGCRILAVMRGQLAVWSAAI